MANQVFATELLKIVIAQICQGLEFVAIEQSACDTLVDVVHRYIEEIGYHARLNADLAGRVDCNYNDVVAALSKMRVAIKDIIEFQSIHCAEEVPFARAVPRFPLPAKQKKRKLLTDGEPHPHCVLPHFPPFPERHTYQNKPLYVAAERDRKEIQKKKNQERSQVEKSLAVLNQEFSSVEAINYETIFDDLPPMSQHDLDILLKKQTEQPKLIPPTPLSTNSPFVTSLLKTNQTDNMEIEETNNGKELDEAEQQQRERALSILALTHTTNPNAPDELPEKS